MSERDVSEPKRLLQVSSDNDAALPQTLPFPFCHPDAQRGICGSLESQQLYTASEPKRLLQSYFRSTFPSCHPERTRISCFASVDGGHICDSPQQAFSHPQMRKRV